MCEVNRNTGQSENIKTSILDLKAFKRLKHHIPKILTLDHQVNNKT